MKKLHTKILNILATEIIEQKTVVLSTPSGLNYSQIHIKFINHDYWISQISRAILKQFPSNFTHYFPFMSWLP